MDYGNNWSPKNASDSSDLFTNHNSEGHSRRVRNASFLQSRKGQSQPQKSFETDYFSFGKDVTKQDMLDFLDFEVDPDFKSILSKPFKKDLYTPHPDTVNRPQVDASKELLKACDALPYSAPMPKEIDHHLSTNNMRVFSEEIHRPILSFHEVQLPDQISKKLRRLDITSPTPIQSVGLPVTLSGRNLVGIAQTGSGKTLSFMLPAVLHAKEQPRFQHELPSPVVVVLCPTRELAKQNRKVAFSLNDGALKIGCFYGGSSRTAQYEAIADGCDILIATPGRLLDFVKQGEVDLRRCTFFVLDEADTMLDMGFEPQIRKIADQIRPDRQMTMWSATWPKEIRRLADQYLENAEEETVYVKVGSTDLTANSDIQQNFHICRSGNKRQLLVSMVRQLVGIDAGELLLRRDDGGRPKILIFVNTKRDCDAVERLLSYSKVRCRATHGAKSQRHRERVLEDFRNGHVSVLVATNVAARGIDVKDIDCVINYDCPTDCVTYIHRIGRTGRAGKRGAAHTFLTEVDGGIVGDLIEALKAADHPVDPMLEKMLRWHKSHKSRR